MNLASFLFAVFVSAVFAPLTHGQTDACSTDADCLNGGTCVGDSGGDITHSNDPLPKYCSCPPGYNGNKCQSDCPLLCQNGGTCFYLPDMHAQSAVESDYQCNCQNGFKGRLCDIPYEECPDGLQCLNGAKCIISDDNDDKLAVTYACQCPYTHSGVLCEIALDVVRCPDGSECINGGVCRLSDATDDLRDVYECACPDTHAGIYCELLVAMQSKANFSRRRTNLPPVAIVCIFLACAGIFVVVLTVIVRKSRGAKEMDTQTGSGLEFSTEALETPSTTSNGSSNAAGTEPMRSELPTSTDKEDGAEREII